MNITRLGAWPVTERWTEFRVWAPLRRAVAVCVEQPDGSTVATPLNRSDDGYFVGRAEAPVGARYRYALDQQAARPDPASFFQPQGVHGPSEVVDHSCYAWRDAGWRGVPKRDLVIYELHVGTFSSTGDYQGVIERLDEIKDLGATAIELLPLAQTPGRWNWGYDGVQWFAPRETYGRPDDLKALVDACHAAGLAVILDVVYNHFGPEGNYLGEFGPYFSKRHHTPWGDAVNFDGDDGGPVSQFVIDNALYWLDVFHLDGLRLDAAHFLYDDRPLPILDRIRQSVSAFEESRGGTLHLIAETNVFDGKLVADRDDVAAYDAIWCDCLMHSVYSLGAPDVELTSRAYRGAADIARSLRSGFVYCHEQGSMRRGESSEREASELESLVVALQTHDSVGNHPAGKRIHHCTSKAFQKAAATLFLLHPGVPMVFMGEETACEAPFAFFADFLDPNLRRVVDAGRRREYPPRRGERVPRPSDPAAFGMSRCHDPRTHDAEMRDWYRRLLALRRVGLSEGWLSATCFQADMDRQRDAFHLAYRVGERGVEAWVRLSGPTGDAPELVSLPTREPVLLATRPCDTADGSLLLAKNEAVLVGSPEIAALLKHECGARRA